MQDNDTPNNNDNDNGVALSEVLTPYYRPTEQTIVCGALDEGKVQPVCLSVVRMI